MSRSKTSNASSAAVVRIVAGNAARMAIFRGDARSATAWARAEQGLQLLGVSLRDPFGCCVEECVWICG
jgi:hypothetical protein